MSAVTTDVTTPPPGTEESPRPPGPWTWWPFAIGGVVALVLLIFAPRYGYHRDELYFLICGQHLQWGYVDQGPFTPAIARVADLLAPDNLLVLRTPPALMAAGTVVLTAAIARELGGSRAAQHLAATIAAVSSIVLATGHLLTTSTFDLLAWVAICWLVTRALRTEDTRLVLAAGAVAGIALLNKYLVVGLGVGLLGGLAIAGPRRWLRDPWVLGGAALALLLWAPALLWQAQNGWPQLDMAESLSTGDTSYGGRITFVLLQLVLISPLLAPVWIAGLVALFRRPEWRPYRALAWTAVLVAALFLVAGGKGYYTAPLLLMLSAAGSIVTVEWVARRRRGLRTGLVAAVLAVSAIAGTVLMLPAIPASRLPQAIVEVNYDAGETIGWPEFTESVAAVYQDLPTEEQYRTAILTGNYGQAGAIDRFGPDVDLPSAYSGHNSMADFGMPAEGNDVVIAVGYSEPRLRRLFAECVLSGRVDQGVTIENDENGGRIWVCRGPRDPWPQLWDRIRHVG